jgi:hypothetical protein
MVFLQEHTLSGYVDKRISGNGVCHSRHGEGGEQHQRARVGVAHVQNRHLAGQRPASQVLVVHIYVDMGEFVPREGEQMVLVEVLVMRLIEIADINAVLEIFRRDQNVSGSEIRPFTGICTNDD